MNSGHWTNIIYLDRWDNPWESLWTTLTTTNLKFSGQSSWVIWRLLSHRWFPGLDLSGSRSEPQSLSHTEVEAQGGVADVFSLRFFLALGLLGGGNTGGLWSNKCQHIWLYRFLYVFCCFFWKTCHPILAKIGTMFPKWLIFEQHWAVLESLCCCFDAYIAHTEIPKMRLPE